MRTAKAMIGLLECVGMKQVFSRSGMQDLSSITRSKMKETVLRFIYNITVDGEYDSFEYESQLKLSGNIKIYFLLKIRLDIYMCQYIYSKAKEPQGRFFS